MSVSKPTFSPGELVNVTIRGARVEKLDDVGRATLALPNHAWRPTVNTRARGVTVERVAPPEWPPQDGDIWAARDDREWFAVTRYGELRLIDPTGEFWTDLDEVTQIAGPMRLVRRRGWTPTPPAADPEPAEVDKRAELIAGLHELADLLEQRPDLYFDQFLSWTLRHTPDPVRGVTAWGDVLGETERDERQPGEIHYYADGNLRGLRLYVSYIERPAEPVGTAGCDCIPGDADEPAPDNWTTEQLAPAESFKAEDLPYFHGDLAPAFAASPEDPDSPPYASPYQYRAERRWEP